MDQTLERATAVFPLCSHMKSNGIRCASPALTGLNFCYQHVGGSVSALARAQATTSSPDARLNLLYPGDHAAIQHNLFQVAQALSEGKINTSMANTYNRIFRTCEQNLHHWEITQKSKSNAAEKTQMLPPPDALPSETAKASDIEEGGPGKPAPGLREEQDGGPIQPALGLREDEQNKPSVPSVVNGQSSPEPDNSGSAHPSAEAQALTSEREAEAMRRFYEITAELERQQAMQAGYPRPA